MQTAQAHVASGNITIGQNLMFWSLHS